MLGKGVSSIGQPEEDGGKVERGMECFVHLVVEARQGALLDRALAEGDCREMPARALKRGDSTVDQGVSWLVLAAGRCDELRECDHPETAAA